MLAEKLLDELYNEIKSQIRINKKVTSKLEEFKNRPPCKENIETLIGKNLSLGRRYRGMSQDQLGRLLGVSFQQIQKYENGKNRISASRLYEVSKILGYPYEFFFQGGSGCGSQGKTCCKGEAFEKKARSRDSI